MSLAFTRDFARHRLGLIGVALILLLIGFCFLGPLVHATDQVHANAAITNVGPGGGHPLGTDANGYDVLGRLMVGGRASLEIGAGVAALATLLGALWGAVAGFTGGALDALMMRVVDTLLALPAIFVLIYLATVVQPTVPLLIGVIAALSWLGPARLIRGETLSLRTREFIEASRAMGAGRTRTIVRHVLPNTLGTLVVNATFQVADAIILLATLSFLGFGLPPPAATWGGMLYQGTSYLLDGYWWEVYPAGIMIMLTVIAFNLIGDALRETLDARLTQR
ncbi:MAG TPA: ABC transporter permease [Solirubrobacteraceae bacterium]|jgi:peptide/nickel transport system permease protein|nr:ABC transporter permease [Solirubrobacteraceae bacterium]